MQRCYGALKVLTAPQTLEDLKSFRTRHLNSGFSWSILWDELDFKKWQLKIHKDGKHTQRKLDVPCMAHIHICSLLLTTWRFIEELNVDLTSVFAECKMHPSCIVQFIWHTVESSRKADQKKAVRKGRKKSLNSLRPTTYTVTLTNAYSIHQMQPIHPAVHRKPPILTLRCLPYDRSSRPMMESSYHVRSLTAHQRSLDPHPPGAPLCSSRLPTETPAHPAPRQLGTLMPSPCLPPPRPHTHAHIHTYTQAHTLDSRP